MLESKEVTSTTTASTGTMSTVSSANELAEARTKSMIDRLKKSMSDMDEQLTRVSNKVDDQLYRMELLVKKVMQQDEIIKQMTLRQYFQENTILMAIQTIAKSTGAPENKYNRFMMPLK